MQYRHTEWYKPCWGEHITKFHATTPLCIDLRIWIVCNIYSVWKYSCITVRCICWIILCHSIGYKMNVCRFVWSSLSSTIQGDTYISLIFTKQPYKSIINSDSKRYRTNVTTGITCDAPVQCKVIAWQTWGISSVNNTILQLDPDFHITSLAIGHDDNLVNVSFFHFDIHRAWKQTRCQVWSWNAAVYDYTTSRSTVNRVILSQIKKKKLLDSVYNNSCLVSRVILRSGVTLAL